MKGNCYTGLEFYLQSMVLNITQVVLAILLSLSILVQNRGTGVGSTFGGGENIAHTKRGAEKFLHYLTIVLAIIFLIVSFLNFLY